MFLEQDCFPTERFLIRHLEPRIRFAPEADQLKPLGKNRHYRQFPQIGRFR